MKIAEYAIRHPAVIGIILISLALFGIISFRGIPRDLMANINLPEVLVLTVYPGAAPEVVERDVTDILEEEFSLIDGIKKISSESQDGFSMVFLTLDWDADMEAKKNDIRDRINNTISSLPGGLAGNPRLFELGTSSLPVYTCIVETTLEESEFAVILRDQFEPRFSRLTDVSAVYVRGVEDPAVRVVLDPGSLESMDITAIEAFAALRRGQGNVPAGFVLSGSDRLTLQSRGDFTVIGQIGTLPVGYDPGGTAVFLQDLAAVEMGTMNPEFRTLSKGRRTVALDIMKRTGGDTEVMVSEVQILQKMIEKEYGGRIRFVPIVDNADTIGLTLKSVGNSAWLGGLLAVIVLLVFLHDIRAAFIVSLSIPFSVFLTFILMRARGMSMNIMTLTGLTVSIGMFVDSSIVMLENTVRHKKTGLSALDAASLGAGEVGGAVLASTTTSMVVFLPILFLSGLAGAILKEVSWVMIFGQAASAVTAIIIVPWLSANLPEFRKAGGLPARFGEHFDKWFDRMSRGYSSFLRKVLDHKGFFILLSAVLVLASTAVISMLGGELFSAPDMNELEVSVRLPSGYNLEKAEVKMRQIAEVVTREVPEIETDLWYAGLGDSATIIDRGNPTEGYGRVKLVRPAQRERSVFEIVDHLNRILPAEITDADIRVQNGGLAKQMNYATDGAGFRVEVSGDNWADVLETAGSVKLLLQEDPLISQASLSVRLDREQMGVELNRGSTGRLAVDPGMAGQNLRVLFAGEEAGTLKTSGDSFPIFVDSSLAGAQVSPGVLGKIRVRNAGGTTVPYSAFSTLERLPSTDSIPHSDRLPSLVVVGEMIEPDLAGIQSRIEPALRSATFPPGVSWRVSGAADVMAETFRNLAAALGISIFLVYAVMVVQFERYLQPFIIMGSVPFVLIGVVLALTAFGGRITMMSFFGVIALGGMVVNNGIILVEFTNQLRKEGTGVRDSILEASRIRLKPILITTLTTLLGLIPLAFSPGEGSQIYAPLGQIIGFGLMTSTLITLALVPALYEWVESRRTRRANTDGRPELVDVSVKLGKGLRKAVAGVRKSRKKGGVQRTLPVLFPVALLILISGGEWLGAQESALLATPQAQSSPRWSASELLDIALTDDPALQAARNEQQSASSQLQGARSQRGPTLDLELGTSYLSDPLLSVPAGSLGTLPAPFSTPLPSEDLEIWGESNDFRYDVAAILEQPLFTWGKISSGVKIAEAGTAAAGWRARSREEELKAGILIAMESLSVIRKMLELTDRQVEIGTRLIELTRSNFEEGFLLETEYRDTRNRIQQILLTQTSLRNQRQDLLLNLRQVTGLKNLETDNLIIPAVDDSLESYSIGTPEELTTSAWMKNPDIQTLSALENMARGELALAEGSLAIKPDVAFRTKFGYGGGFDRAPDDINGNWTLTFGAVSTLVDSGRSRSGISSARADLNAAGSRSENGRREMETFIRSTLYSMSLNRENAVYYSGLRDTDTARAALKRSSWEAGYGREEEWLLAELDSLASELSRYREVLLFIRSDRQVRKVAGILSLAGIAGR